MHVKATASVRGIHPDGGFASPALARIIGKTRITALHGGLYPGPSRYQDLQYQRRVERLMAERAKQAKVTAG